MQTIDTHHLDGQVCIKFGGVGTLFIYKLVDTTMKFMPSFKPSFLGRKVDYSIDKEGHQQQT
jgi:hypothetical protein